MAAFLDRLRDPRRVLLDGAMGTALLALGLDLSRERAPAWNLRRPGDVLAVHRAHVAAGAELVLTNTFVAQDAPECAAGLALARESGAALVGGSLFAGLPDLAERVRALSGADVLWLETATSGDEAARAVAVARAATALPIVVTCARISQIAAPDGVAAAGFNCSPWLPERARPALPALPVPLVFKPDAASLAPEEWAALVDATGARLVGGCCGTTPAHLAALQRRLARPRPGTSAPPSLPRR